jgi:hypothetical protein
MIDQSILRPGDVLCVATHDLGGFFIRLRSWFQRKPHGQNHVAMFTHFDSEGIPRGMEGRPSSFGWVNLTTYLKDPSLVTNAGHTTFPMEQRQLAVAQAWKMIGTPYDWATIIALGLGMIGLPFHPKEWPEDGLPAEAECASAIDLIYEAQGWANPGGWKLTRGTDVDDWVAFIQDGNRVTA